MPPTDNMLLLILPSPSFGRFANWWFSQILGTSTSARHPDVTALFAEFPTKHSAALKGSLQHSDGERLCIRWQKTTREQTAR